MAYMTTTVRGRDGQDMVAGCRSDHFNYERIVQHAALLDRPVWMFDSKEKAVDFHGPIVDWSADDVQGEVMT